MNVRGIFIVVCLLGCATRLSAEPITQSAAPPIGKNGEALIALVHYLAGSGDSEAQALLEKHGDARFEGLATLTPLEALSLAAENNVPEAALVLANRLYSGNGMPRDRAAAATWWRRAAQAGLSAAAYNLGLAHAHGVGTDRNLRAAKIWFAQAARQGHAPAAFALGVLALKPSLAPVDYPAARQHFEQAAQAGLAVAQFNLAILWEHGLGTQAQHEVAVSWYERAAANGLERALAACTRLQASCSAVRDSDAIRQIFDSAWVEQRDQNHYTLQVATGASESAIIEILKRFDGTEIRAHFVATQAENTRHVALVGSFEHYHEALAYLEALSDEQAARQPWIRRFGSLQQLKDQ